MKLLNTPPKSLSHGLQLGRSTMMCFATPLPWSLPWVGQTFQNQLGKVTPTNFPQHTYSLAKPKNPSQPKLPTYMANVQQGA